MAEDPTKTEPPDLAQVFLSSAEFDAEGDLMTNLPHSEQLGMRLHYCKLGSAVLSVPWHEKLVGDPETGVLHGGVITALLDTACGTAVMSAPLKLRSTATLDLRIDYMRPAIKGRTVYCEATCVRSTHSIGFVSARAFHDTAEDLVATATATFILERIEAKA